MLSDHYCICPCPTPTATSGRPRRFTPTAGLSSVPLLPWPAPTFACPKPSRAPSFFTTGLPARVSRRSLTRTRMPRMQGRPPHSPASQVIRSRRFMAPECRWSGQRRGDDHRGRLHPRGAGRSRQVWTEGDDLMYRRCTDAKFGARNFDLRLNRAKCLF